ncbi:MAG: flagellar motor switch protein FliG, partial [Bryobacterales bacterium]|nr:flagellar motor switch protein FliG [Bryobacterales bacterium]
MITNAEKPTSMMPGIKKAAVLMVVVGDHAASEVLSRLTEDEASKLSREIARTSTVPPELAEAVLEEAYQMSVAQEYVAQGGIDYARKLLISAYGPEAARR